MYVNAEAEGLLEILLLFLLRELPTLRTEHVFEDLEDIVVLAYDALELVLGQQVVFVLLLEEDEVCDLLVVLVVIALALVLSALLEVPAFDLNVFAGGVTQLLGEVVGDLWEDVEEERELLLGDGVVGE